MGTNDIVRGNVNCTKSDYRVLGALVNGMRGPGIVLLKPALDGKKNVRKKALILYVNSCLGSWCQQQDFDFCDRWTLLGNQ